MKRFLKIMCLVIALFFVMTGSLIMNVVAASNPYPSSQTISGVTTIPCTYYAWQQVYDRLGIALPNWGNAINWLNRANTAGYSTGSVAKENSIAVFQSSAHSYGHVSFVTSVNGNNMTINEGGMQDGNGNAANGTGIRVGAIASSVVGTKKDSYSSCTLLGFIYLSGTPTVTVSYSINDDNCWETNNNIFVDYSVNKPLGYTVSDIGIKFRKEGESYSNDKMHIQTPSINYSNWTSVPITWDFKDELGWSLTHATKYYFKFYTKINGTEYWSNEYSATTTGSHSYGSWTTTKAATCTASGSKTRKCSGCSKTETQSISALGHNYSSSYTVDKVATCTAAGSKSKHCSRCSATTSVTAISATGHSYGSWTTTKSATCTSPGTKTRKCSSCSITETATINAFGHNYSNSWTTDTAATCTFSGSKSHHCSRCNAKTDITTISALGHNFGTWKVVREATTASAGEQVRNCMRDGCSVKEHAEIAKLAEDGHTHAFSEWRAEKQVSCTDNGSLIRICSVCKQQETKTVSALGHSFSDWTVVKEATSENDGLSERKCSLCGESETTVIPKIKSDIVDEDLNSETQSSENKEITSNATDIQNTKDSKNSTYIALIMAFVVILCAAISITIYFLKRKQ